MKSFKLLIGLIFNLLFFNAKGQEFLNSIIMSGDGNVEIRKSALDSQGNIVVGGKLNGTTDFDPGPGVVNKTSNGNTDSFFAKYSPTGELIFVNSFGSSQMDYVESCAVDGDGNIVLACRGGGTIDYNPGSATNNLSSGVILAKYNSSGQFLWANRINNGLWSNELAITSTNEIVLSGLCYNNNDMDPSASTALVVMPPNLAGVYVAKYSATGAYIMHKTVYGTLGTEPEALALDSEDNIFFAGGYLGVMDVNPGGAVLNKTAQNQDIFLIKLNSSGDFIWGNSFGGASGDVPHCLVTDSQNNVYMTGLVFSQTDFDPSSSTVLYGGACPNKGNAFLVKYNSNGGFMWLRDFHNNVNGETSESVAVDADDNVYITGYFKPASNNSVIVGVVNSFYSAVYGILGYDVFILKFASNGNYLCHRVVANYVAPVIVNNIDLTVQGDLNIIVDNNNRIFISGGFQSVIDFDPNSDAGNYSATLLDGFITVYTQLDPECNIPGNNGCTNELACNYNPNAFSDNGTCTFNCLGCTDPMAVNFEPTATQNNGSCDYDNDQDGVSIGNGDCNDNIASIYPGGVEVCNSIDDDCDELIDENAGQFYYADSDNDGFGSLSNSVQSCSPVPGFVANSTDCNDNNNSIRPNAVELCDNVDNNCNGVVDDNCSTLVNDQRLNAVLLSVASYNSCSTTSGTLIGATVSLESVTNAITGQDVWYKFIAPAPGIRIRVITTQVNAMIELQSEAGALIESENIRTGLGNETLNFGGLTSGSTYYIAVRNYNSDQGTGSFSICLSRMNAPAVSVSNLPYTSCNYLASSFVSAQSYTFIFTSTTTGQSFTRTQSSASCLLSNVLNLPFGGSFTVQVNAQFSALNGLNAQESIIVAGQMVGPITTISPALTVSSIQQCPASVQLNRNIRTNVALCNVSDYRWSVQVSDLSAPAFEISTGTSRYLAISAVNGFVGEETYLISVRPTYNNGFVGQWGQASCVNVSLSLGMIAEDEDAEDELRDEVESLNQFLGVEGTSENEESSVAFNDDIRFKLYPNPSTNEVVRIHCSGVNNGISLIQVFDSMGREVRSRTIAISSSVCTEEIDLSGFPPGMYVVRLSDETTYLEELLIKN
jgi:Putative metal-binding motif/Secretion system C-terminal sorting domain